MLAIFKIRKIHFFVYAWIIAHEDFLKLTEINLDDIKIISKLISRIFFTSRTKSIIYPFDARKIESVLLLFIYCQ